MFTFNCLRCGECCRSYYIVSLPHEVKGQASFLGISEKDFVQGKMQLYLQLFPAEPSEGKMNIAAEGLPKKILKKIEARLGFRPENFIALPMLCFKRAGPGMGAGKAKAWLGACIFYDSKKGCAIYSVRPDECRLFPFISMDKDADFRKIYRFCKGLQKGPLVIKWDYEAVQAHFRETAKYLSEAKKKGFKATWKNWPANGVCLLEGKLLCKISEKEFFEALGAYS